VASAREDWRQRIIRPLRNDFVHATSVLAGGTAAAQIITLVALPLLTRLYSPSDFKLLAVYLSLVAIAVAVACLRFEIAIPIPKHDSEAAQLLGLSLVSAAAMGAAWAVAVFFAGEQIARLAGAPGLVDYLWLLPLGIWLAGSYAALQYWSNRKRRHAEVARTRVTQAVVGVGTQLGLGIAGVVPFGLLFGHMLYGGAGAAGLALSAWRAERRALKRISWPRMAAAFGRYRRFPLYSTFEALANSSAVQLPPLLIAALVAGPEAGFLLLATRVMAAPLQLVGAAVGQVYLSRAPEAWRDGALRTMSLRVVSGIGRCAVPCVAIGGLSAPFLFPLFFGDEWQRAGEIALWITPWVALQFLASPVSMSLHVTGRQRLALGLQVVGLLLRVGAVVGAAYVLGGYVVEAYAISSAVFYAIYLATVLTAIGRGNARRSGRRAHASV
jgi:O-antigen/teichoic acid export membrane protein